MISGKKNYAFIFLAFGLCYFITPSTTQAALNYPNCHDNPFLNDRMQNRIAPHLLPLDHPMKIRLDAIFSGSRVIENERSLLDAGFTVVAGPMPVSFIIVARHPAVPGYVFKMYLDSENRSRKGIPHWLSLARRCDGAQGIRKIIGREKIRHFSVPDKWLYVLPVYPFSSVLNPEPLVLMETDMELESYETTKHMWKTVVTHKHLDELYSLLKHGYGGRGTVCLSINVPYTKQGKFAFTDTESPKAHLELKNVKKYLSKDMQRYWDRLIHK